MMAGGMNELMNQFDTIDPNTLRAIEEMQRVSDLIGRDWKRTVEMISNIDFERIVKLSEEHRRAIGRLESQSRWLSGLGLNALTSAGATYNRMIEDVLRAVEPTTLALTDASVLAANVALADACGLDSRLSELWAHISEGEQEFTDERVETDLKALNEFSRAALERTATASWPNVLSIMSVILTVSLAYNTCVQQQKMEARLTAKIEESRTAIIEEVQEQFRALEPGLDRAWFVGRRKVFIRHRRRAYSQTAGKLYPGQLVSVIEDCGRKLKIAYFDLQAGEPREGWVLKKHLKRVPTQPNQEIVLPE